jgi:hypothetical protein
MSLRNRIPFINIKLEPEDKLKNRLHVRSIERKIEDQLILSDKQEWDFNQFVHSVMEALIVMRARDKLKRRNK